MISLDDTQRMIAVARGVHVDDAIYDYVVRLVAATRGLDQLRLGVVDAWRRWRSIRASRALAVAQGRPFITVDDIKVLAPAALGHRMLLYARRRAPRRAPLDLVDDAPRPHRDPGAGPQRSTVRTGAAR